MIIKIDHIALSSGNFEKTTDTLKLLGYTTVFSEQNVPNLRIKKELLRTFSPIHNISLLQSEENLSIEILDHGNINPEKSYIIPIFENVPLSFLKDTITSNDGITTVNEKNTGFDADIQVLGQSGCSDLNFTKIRMVTENIQESIDFWKNFGFGHVTAGDESAILEFSSIINRKKYELHLERVDHVRKRSFLDDTGFNCIAFISTSLNRDRNTLIKKEIAVTNIGTLTLNNKNLNLFFCTGLYCEPIEIVEFCF